MIRALIMLGSVLTIVGCAHEHLPTYPRVAPPQLISAMRQRSCAVHSVSGSGIITLTRAGGESVRLDGAIVMQPPDRARLRAWKFGRAVFDLTLTPQGVWLFAPTDSDQRERIERAGASASQLVRTWSMLLGRFFDTQNLTAHAKGDSIVFSQPQTGGGELRCELQQSTRTVRRYSLVDDRAIERFSLVLSRYRTFNDIAWPTRIVARSETGTVQVDLSETEINGELTPQAFVPPRRATTLP
jgi:hypothetical protein